MKKGTVSSALRWSGKTDRFLSQVEIGVPSKQREQCKQRYRCQKLQGHFREHKRCTILFKRRESMRVTGNGLDQVVSCSVTWRVVWTSELEPNWGDSAHHHYFYPGLPIYSISPALLEHPSALLLSVSIVTSPPCNQSALFKSELITLLFINHPWLPTILSVKSGFFLFYYGL